MNKAEQCCKDIFDDFDENEILKETTAIQFAWAEGRNISLAEPEKNRATAVSMLKDLDDNIALLKLQETLTIDKRCPLTADYCTKECVAYTPPRTRMTSSPVMGKMVAKETRVAAYCRHLRLNLEDDIEDVEGYVQ